MDALIAPIYNEALRPHEKDYLHPLNRGYTHVEIDEAISAINSGVQIIKVEGWMANSGFNPNSLVLHAQMELLLSNKTNLTFTIVASEHEEHYSHDHDEISLLEERKQAADAWQLGNVLVHKYYRQNIIVPAKTLTAEIIREALERSFKILGAPFNPKSYHNPLYTDRDGQVISTKKIVLAGNRANKILLDEGQTEADTSFLKQKIKERTIFEAGAFVAAVPLIDVDGEREIVIVQIERGKGPNQDLAVSLAIDTKPQSEEWYYDDDTGVSFQAVNKIRVK